MHRKWWTLIVVCVAIFMLLLDITVVNVALPKIAQGLKASFSDIQWVVDAYALTLASLLLTTGALADLVGRRLVFTIGLQTSAQQFQVARRVAYMTIGMFTARFWRKVFVTGIGSIGQR